MIYVRRGEIITKRRLVGWLETNKKIGLGKMHGLNFFFWNWFDIQALSALLRLEIVVTMNRSKDSQSICIQWENKWKIN